MHNVFSTIVLSMLKSSWSCEQRDSKQKTAFVYEFTSNCLRLLRIGQIFIFFFKTLALFLLYAAFASLASMFNFVRVYISFSTIEMPKIRISLQVNSQTCVCTCVRVIGTYTQIFNRMGWSGFRFLTANLVEFSSISEIFYLEST